MPSSFTHLPSQNFRRVPWKNGGGLTAEIAVHPPGATLDAGFDWRLSIAEVAASGPFSAFPGYDRCIVQLSGQPMLLDHEVLGVHRLQLLEPYYFRGDWPTTANLAAPARDFNCMTRRGRIDAKVEVLTITGAAPIPFPVGGLMVVLAIERPISCAFNGITVCLAVNDAAIAVTTAPAEPASSGDELTLSASGHVLVVTLKGASSRI